MTIQRLIAATISSHILRILYQNDQLRQLAGGATVNPLRQFAKERVPLKWEPARPKVHRRLADDDEIGTLILPASKVELEDADDMWEVMFSENQAAAIALGIMERLGTQSALWSWELKTSRD